jgi:hypothetical protein
MTARREGSGDDDALLAWHNDRLQEATAALKLVTDGSAGYPAIQTAAARIREQLQAADAALRTAIGADPDMRAKFALLLALTEMWIIQVDFVLPDPVRIRGLINLGAQVRQPSAEYRATLDAAEGMYAYWTDMSRASGGTDRGVTAFARALASDGATVDPDGLHELLSMTLHARGGGTGVVGDRVASEQVSNSGPADIAQAALKALSLMQAEDKTPFLAAADRLEALFRALPEGSLDRANSVLIVTPLLQQAALMRGLSPQTVDLGPVPRPDGFLGLLHDLVFEPGRIAEAVRTNDVAALRRCATRVDTVLTALPARHYLRLGCADMAGLAYQEIARRDRRDPHAPRISVERYAEAAALAGSPQHPHWSRINMALAASARMLQPPDHARTRAAGLSALRGYAWQATVQSGTDHAMQVVREASRAAVIVASWCFAETAYPDLIAALDAGRGLTLAAAVLTRGIATRLDAAGHHELAEQWRATAGRGRDQMTGDVLGTATTGWEVSDDLRPRVLRALQGDTTAGDRLRLAEPIDAADIRAALTASAADALVYLVPAGDGWGGYAAVVPAHGPIEILPMPALTVAPGSLPQRYATGGVHRGGTERRGTGAREISRPTGPVSAGPSLTDVCAWAWNAAMGRLVDTARRWRTGRTPHLVLVPMGALALVPWHAAFDPAARTRRYAVDYVVVSYTVSADMLRTTSARPLRRVASALIVGDPTGDLGGAGAEARAIQRRFYPAGTYFGKPAGDATGTPEEVLAWIRSAGAGPSLLHLACHARVDRDRPAESHLVLAGGARLTADALLDSCRLAALEIDRVFLAACTTSTGGDEHDEAFSIASAFLSAGAHTVFGTLWPVPDDETALLMYMVHHFLEVDGETPAVALHRAQRWMIDPLRRPVPGMPADLAGIAGRPGAAAPEAWAGFTHLGR